MGKKSIHFLVFNISIYYLPSRPIDTTVMVEPSVLASTNSSSPPSLSSSPPVSPIPSPLHQNKFSSSGWNTPLIPMNSRLSTAPKYEFDNLPLDMSIKKQEPIEHFH
jgi:hypothetical protein